MGLPASACSNHGASIEVSQRRTVDLHLSYLGVASASFDAWQSILCCCKICWLQQCRPAAVVCLRLHMRLFNSPMAESSSSERCCCRIYGPTAPAMFDSCRLGVGWDLTVIQHSERTVTLLVLFQPRYAYWPCPSSHTDSACGLRVWVRLLFGRLLTCLIYVSSSLPPF